MELSSAGNVPGESHRFIVAVIAAAVFHVLFFATWSFLPFARAEPMTADVIDAEPPALEVQFVAPPPEPAPAPPEPEPAKPEPMPVAENIMTALKETEPEPVVEEPPAPEPPPIEAVKPPVPRPPARKAPPPPPPSRTRPAPKPVAVPKPMPAPTKRTAIVSRPQAAAALPPTAPSYRSNPKPAYPAEAKRLRIEGTTFLKVEVLASGNVGTVTVLKSSGNGLLDQSAASTVQNRWRFRPATRAGHPISTFVTVPIRFTLR